MPPTYQLALADLDLPVPAIPFSNAFEGVNLSSDNCLPRKMQLSKVMATSLHPAAPHYMPWFITAPGDTDTLFVVATVVVIVSILLIGVLFFWLHSLPERLGHKKLQFEVVAVLGLLSLFTHMHIFWIIGLLLAVIDLPDFMSPLRRMATSSEKLAGIEPPPAADSQQHDSAEPGH